MLAWRDLADVEAGGRRSTSRRWRAGRGRSRRHAADVVRRANTSGRARDGYCAIRRAGRYCVLRAALSEAVERHGKWDDGRGVERHALPVPVVDAGRPHVVFMHHLHAEMWRMVLPENPVSPRQEVLERQKPPCYAVQTDSRGHLVRVVEAELAVGVQPTG